MILRVCELPQLVQGACLGVRDLLLLRQYADRSPLGRRREPRLVLARFYRGGVPQGIELIDPETITECGERKSRVLDVQTCSAVSE